jgi:hypothetical protein
MKYVENLLLYIVLEVKQGLLCDENDWCKVTESMQLTLNVELVLR